MTDKTFIRITNKDIYEKLCEVEAHVKETNGKVKVNSWVSKTSLSLTIIVIGAIIGLIVKFI